MPITPATPPRPQLHTYRQDCSVGTSITHWLTLTILSDDEGLDESVREGPSHPPRGPLPRTTSITGRQQHQDYHNRRRAATNIRLQSTKPPQPVIPSTSTRPRRPFLWILTSATPIRRRCRTIPSRRTHLPSLQRHPVPCHLPTQSIPTRHLQ